MEFTTQNGQKDCMITAASFKDAVNLKKAAMKCLLNVDTLKGINFDNLQGLDSSKVFDALGQLIVNMDVSEEFEKAVFACLANCTYDGFFKINMQLFDDKPEAREDYYEIVSKCCEVNLSPFFKSLVSELKQRFKAVTENIQEQE